MRPNPQVEPRAAGRGEWVDVERLALDFDLVLFAGAS
jgi:hypothetical protein